MSMSGIRVDEAVISLIANGFINKPSGEKALRRLQAMVLKLSPKKDKFLVDRVVAGTERPPDLFRRLTRDVLEDFKKGACWIVFEFLVSTTANLSAVPTMVCAKYVGDECPVGIRMACANAHMSLKTGLTGIPIFLEISGFEEWTIESFMDKVQSNKTAVEVDGLECVKNRISKDIFCEKLKFLSYEEFEAKVEREKAALKESLKE